MLTLPTWDLFITLCFLIGLGYGLILGRERIITTLVASFIGFAVANEVGNAIFATLSGSNLINDSIWVKTNLSVFAVKTTLFALIVVLLTTKGEFGAIPGAFSTGLKGVLVTGLYSFLTSGLVISSIISFLPENALNALLAQSTLANSVLIYRNWWLIGPVILMIALGTFASGGSSE